jgi:hypothetical protein
MDTVASVDEEKHTISFNLRHSFSSLPKAVRTDIWWDQPAGNGVVVEPPSHGGGKYVTG